MLIDNDSKILVGSTNITKVYAGNNLVYEKQSTPSYTPLNYIQSTGLQQIDTGYVPTENTRVEIDFKLTRKQNEDSIIACKWDLNGFVLLDTGSGLRWHNSSSTFYNFSYNSVNTKRCLFSIYRNQIYVDGTVALNQGYTTITYTDTIKLFGFSSSHPAYYQLYGFKIYENEVLVHNFVPAKDTNNTVCLYDIVDNRFYYDANGRTFDYYG